jgi:FixJ family two-component response regulator
MPALVQRSESQSNRFCISNKANSSNEPASDSRADNKHSGSRQIVIAVLDDEDSVRKALVRVLRAAGFAASGFSCGEEFLESLHSDCPQCLLLDLRLPGFSGQEVHQALIVAGAQFPIIIITAQDGPNTREECLRLGAAFYICKPVDADTLLQTVRSTIGSPG